MPSIYQVAVVTALVSLVSAVPFKSTFSVPQVVHRPGFKTSGPAAMAKTYAKFNKEMPPIIAAAAATADGTVPANPTEYDSEYLEAVTIGTPGVTLMLNFDTGSSDLWVFSSQLAASSQSGHTIYNPAKSSTAKVLSDSTWSIRYGDGSSASGNVYTDKVAVGALVVTTQAVELAQKVSASFVSNANDGLLGLGLDSINTVSPTKQKTFFSNAKATLTSPLFTADLKKGAPGSYDFGYIDNSKYSGSITYVNVKTSNGFWEFTSNGYAVGSGSFVSSSINSIADTGTTLLYLPQSVVAAYYAKVSGAKLDNNQGGYTFPCSATLPSISLGIGSYKAVVPGSYMNYAPVSSTVCFGGIQPNTGLGFSIFGDVFLKSQFVVFSAGSTYQLGFAPKPT